MPNDGTSRLGDQGKPEEALPSRDAPRVPGGAAPLGAAPEHSPQLWGPARDFQAVEVFFTMTTISF